MCRTGSFDSLGQFFKLGSEYLKFSSKRFRVRVCHACGRIEQGFKHHCDARKDRDFDPFEGFFEPRLLFALIHR